LSQHATRSDHEDFESPNAASWLQEWTMKRHWMPLYIADYLAGTAHLTTAEHGAYLLLIMHYWSKGARPGSDEVARRVTRMTNHQWSKSLPVLKSFFLEDWRHERLEAELAQVAERSKANSGNARKSHLSRRALASNPQHTTTIYNQIINDVEGTRPAPATENETASKATSLALAFLKAAGLADRSKLSPGWYSLNDRAGMWIAAGYSTAMIVEETKIVVERSTDLKPIAYFEKAFATAYARQRRPLPVTSTPPPEQAHVGKRRPHKQGRIYDALDGQIALARAFEQTDCSGSAAGCPEAPRMLPTGRCE
jgi:uncharacterized protein YdaU (DUF1376 family)